MIGINKSVVINAMTHIKQMDSLQQHTYIEQSKTLSYIYYNIIFVTRDYIGIIKSLLKLIQIVTSYGLFSTL